MVAKGFGQRRQHLPEVAAGECRDLQHRRVAEEAETIYWEDLRRNPDNGWSLFGLARALAGSSRVADAFRSYERTRVARANRIVNGSRQVGAVDGAVDGTADTVGTDDTAGADEWENS